jgi:hypothetical protein
MKKIANVILLGLIMAVALTSVNSYGQEFTADPLGAWTVDVPYAPEGFQVSRLTIAKVDDKYTAEMNFTEIGYVIKGEAITFLDKVFKYGFWVEGEYVTITLKFTAADKMEGVGTTSGGELPITAARVKDK